MPPRHVFGGVLDRLFFGSKPHPSVAQESAAVEPGAEQEHTTASPPSPVATVTPSGVPSPSPPRESKPNSGVSPEPKNNGAGDSQPSFVACLLSGQSFPPYVQPNTLRAWLDWSEFDPDFLSVRFDWKHFEVATDFIVVPALSTLDWNTYGEIILWSGPNKTYVTPLDGDGQRSAPPRVLPPAFSNAPDPEDDEYTIFTWVGPCTLSLQPPLFAYEAAVEFPDRFKLTRHL